MVGVVSPNTVSKDVQFNLSHPSVEDQMTKGLARHLWE